ncbi:MAG: Holliday junction resolvase RuvX [Chloroflexaceae bacterium]|nr:Holliday junction resolvase RuvX [Chloroflexaceae bacterium]
MAILGFDPGRDKCGIAVMANAQVLHLQVVTSAMAIATLNSLLQQFPIERMVMGDRTTAKQWRQQLAQDLTVNVPITMVDESYSTLQARDRYWQMYPPQGLQRFIPQGLRLPPRPIDDIVAILLIERYLQSSPGAV